MLLMGMNCFTLIYVFSLVTHFISNRRNDRWNIFKGIHFLMGYKESPYTFLLNYFHGSCEVHTEIFDTWNMSVIKAKRQRLYMLLFYCLTTFKSSNILGFVVFFFLSGCFVFGVLCVCMFCWFWFGLVFAFT